MILEGRVWKDGKLWLIEVPALEAMTQGSTRKEALAMIEDWVHSILDDQAYDVRVALGRSIAGGGHGVSVITRDPGPLVALMLRRQREAAKLSLAEVAHRLGEKSRNAYARYEQGKSIPTIEKLGRLVRAVRPDADVVLRIG